jgi:hypothetical protein
MIACIGVAILGDGALIAMTWAGVLRVGEALAAARSDLILPRDAARELLELCCKLGSQRQEAEPPGILDLAFRRFNPDERLWPWSPSKLRRRFALLLAALGIADSQGCSHFNLSSLRPGGATHWLAQTEDAEFVRPRGRWLSTRVLEIYLQEAPTGTYQKRLTSEPKSRIQDFCNFFPKSSRKRSFFKATHIPEEAWPKLW